jgi:hypothetical protein
MKDRRAFLTILGAAPSAAAMQTANAGGDRAYWIAMLERVAGPVLENMSRGTLHARMPVEARPGVKDRPEYTHLEAIGRTLTGIAPWLELGPGSEEEGRRRARVAESARAAIAHAVDPAGPDYCNFERGRQPLVDAAFLAHGILRAPRELWEKLPAPVQRNVVAAMIKTRRIKPGQNNWLLFAALVEALLARVGETWDRPRVETALTAHEKWYKGDGIYGDGPNFHWDYYNSFVIHPMMLDVLAVLGKESPDWEALHTKEVQRARRYAAIQERLISPEGSYPPIGRSIAYRMGAFQLLGQMALRKQLPQGVSPAQVRCGLTAVMKRQMERPGTFDAKGWLLVGLAGHQPSLGETYISTGSLYLCCAVFCPLGLPASDEFWSAPAEPWTARKLWDGVDAPADHAG